MEKVRISSLLSPTCLGGYRIFGRSMHRTLMLEVCCHPGAGGSHCSIPHLKPDNQLLINSQAVYRKISLSRPTWPTRLDRLPMVELACPSGNSPQSHTMRANNNFTPLRRELWSAQHLQQIRGASVTTPYGQGPQQPYGQQPYGAPQMGYPAAPGGVKPNNYLAWSIVSIFLFWPLGIAAIINATKVDPAWQMGNAAMAQEHSNKAKMFSMIATIIGAVGFVIYFIIGWRFGLSLFGSE